MVMSWEITFKLDFIRIFLFNLLQTFANICYHVFNHGKARTPVTKETPKGGESFSWPRLSPWLISSSWKGKATCFGQWLRSIYALWSLRCRSGTNANLQHGNSGFTTQPTPGITAPVLWGGHHSAEEVHLTSSPATFGDKLSTGTCQRFQHVALWRIVLLGLVFNVVHSNDSETLVTD